MLGNITRNVHIVWKEQPAGDWLPDVLQAASKDGRCMAISSHQEPPTTHDMGISAQPARGVWRYRTSRGLR